MIRLPFGVHRKSNKVYPFLNREDGLPIAPTIREQIDILAHAKTVSKADLVKYTSLATQTVDTSPPASTNRAWDEIKRAAPIMSFIERFIELTPTPTGGIGYCPFHEDENPSFRVHVKGNYWHCFAGCGGGSVIDFYMKWKKLEFKEAVNEMREMLNGTDIYGS